MRYKLFDRTARKHLRKHPREKRFVSYSKAHDILLLFESDGKDEQIIEIVKKLRQDNKNVAAWGFAGSKIRLTANLPDGVKIFNKKNINLLRKPNEKIVREVTGCKYDLLIDLSQNSLIPLLYLSLLAEAGMKTASKKTGWQLFDFILDISNAKANGNSGKATDEQYIFSEIIFYLKSIQTTD